MPNRRRRRLSTATSAFTGLVIASPFAVAAVLYVNASLTPAPQEREFVPAATITDLPAELYSALQSSLSQFGIVLPNIPSSLMGTSTPPGLTSPGLTSPGLTAPTTFPPLTGEALTDPGLTNPALTDPALTNPTDPATALTTPLTDIDAPLTSPADPVPTLATPLIGDDSALATPGLTAPSEVPISAPIGLEPGLGLDPTLGTYPILGDPLLSPAPQSSGGLIGELSNVANQLGASQAMDLFRGVLMPQITQAIQNAAPPPVAPPPAAPPVAG